MAFPPPPTSNTLSSKERSVLVRSSRKLSRVLGDTPHFVDHADDVQPVPSRPSTSSGLPELTRTTAPSFSAANKDPESTWHKRKPSHIPPLLKLANGVPVDCSPPTLSPTYQRPPTRRESVLSTAPSIVSNASGSSNSDTPSESSLRRTKLERVRRTLGDEVPAEVVFSSSSSQRVPETPRTAVPKTATHRAHTDDARSITFSISSDESVQTVTFTASTTTTTHLPSPHPHKTKQVYQTGALPPHLSSRSISSRRGHGRNDNDGNDDDDDAGLLRPRQKIPAGSKIGGSEFKAARRAKREGRAHTGQADVGEIVEMVGFLR